MRRISWLFWQRWPLLSRLILGRAGQRHPPDPDTGIAYAGELGYIIKLLGHAGPRHRRLYSCLVAKTSQLAQISGALNAVEFRAEPVQGILCTGPGQGRANRICVLADLIDVASVRGGLPFGMRVGQLAKGAPKQTMANGFICA